jgi:inner membrane protein
MASLGHVAVGVAAGSWRGERARERVVYIVLFTALSLLPDADVIAFALDIPYEHAFGHRGASHSLIAALAIGALLLVRPAPDRMKTAAFGAIVTASHGLLDALTDGGLGVALFWPFTDARYFAPWRPIPVAPIGAGLVSSRGLYVMAVEAVMFTPLWIAAAWPWIRALRAGRGGT